MHKWLTCPTCEKYVRLKPWLGTLHFCLTPEELAAKRWRAVWARHTFDEQRRIVARGGIQQGFGVWMTEPRPAEDAPLS